MVIDEVELKVPDGFQLIVGQAHFIKTVEDLYEALASSMPGAKFGVAFSEASGKALIRFDGSDKACTDLARGFAGRLGAGHSFVVVLKDAFPINVLPRLRSVEEVVAIHCATSNPVVVFVARTGKGSGVIGVADGASPAGEEDEKERAERHELLRKIGYKR
jgi:uncharacterized protein